MPARVVMVHDDPAIRDAVVAALAALGCEIAAFDDPLTALDAMDATGVSEVLITRIRFPAGKPHGIAVARMARAKRPGLHVLITDQPELAEHADGLGEFLPAPLDPAEVVEAVARVMKIPT